MSSFHPLLSSHLARAMTRTTRKPARRRDTYGPTRAGKRPKPPRSSGGGQRRNAEGLIIDDRYDWQPTASFSRSGQGSGVDTPPPVDVNAPGGVAQPMSHGPAMAGATPAITSGLTFGANVPTLPLPQGLYSALALDPRRRRR